MLDSKLDYRLPEMSCVTQIRSNSPILVSLYLGIYPKYQKFPINNSVDRIVNKKDRSVKTDVIGVEPIRKLET